MRSNLYGGKLRDAPRDVDPRGADKHHLEEQLYRENEAMLEALGQSVRGMGAMAATLHGEAREQNHLLRGLDGTFRTARAGVGTSLNGLKNVMGRHGCRQTLYIAVAVFFALYFLYAMLF